MSWLAKILRASCFRFNPPAGKSLVEMLSAGAVLVDVRSAGEFAAGHIEGALWLPLDRIHLDIATAVPTQNQPLILYCRSGGVPNAPATSLNRWVTAMRSTVAGLAPFRSCWTDQSLLWSWSWS